MCLSKNLDNKRLEKTNMAVGINARMVTYVVHALALLLAGMVLFWTLHYRGGFAWESLNKALIFNLHPVLMLIGIVIVGGEAVISHKSLPLEKPVKKTVHLVLHAIALTLGIWGLVAAFKNHNEASVPNLYSVHSWIGIGVISLYSLQWLCSFIAFVYPRGSATLRSDLLPWHVFLGIFVYVLAVGNTAAGFVEKVTLLEKSGLDKFAPEAYLINFMAIVTILFGFFVMLAVSAKSPPPSGEEDNYSYSAI